MDIHYFTLEYPTIHLGTFFSGEKEGTERDRDCVLSKSKILLQHCYCIFLANPKKFN